MFNKDLMDKLGEHMAHALANYKPQGEQEEGVESLKVVYEYMVTQLTDANPDVKDGKVTVVGLLRVLNRWGRDGWHLCDSGTPEDMGLDGKDGGKLAFLFERANLLGTDELAAHVANIEGGD